MFGAERTVRRINAPPNRVTRFSYLVLRPRSSLLDLWPLLVLRLTSKTILPRTLATMSSEVNQPRRDRHTAACQNKQPRFDPEEFHFRRQVFRQYRCPFRDEPNRGCFREDKPDRCFFAHPDTPDLPPFVQLIDVPTYICIYSLINGCHFTTVDKPRVSLIGTWNLRFQELLL